ncbi:MAG: hypothetical protein H6744_09590 [Deltaproteobacteria bacterium]|nr:hypothetical protein [Deltaproteobacteria bacterium]
MNRVAGALMACALSWAACDDGQTVLIAPEPDAQSCLPGGTQLCVCAGGVSGAQSCASDGASWLPCECVTPTPDVAPDVEPDVALDVEPDVAPDVVPDVEPDVATDVEPDAAPDVPAQDKSYFAVYIQDQWDGINCGSSDPSRMSPGADIDAVELITGTTIIGFFDVVRGMSNPTGNTKCANAFDDPNLAKGAPDATKNWENYFSLYDGWLIGEFTNAAEIQPGDTIRIYELGPSHPLSTEGKDEPYEAYIATGIECVDDLDPTVNCMIPLSAEALGTATLSVPAF